MKSADAKPGDAPSRIPYPNPGWARLISITLAIALATLFFTHSHSIAGLYHDISPWLPGSLMWGIACGFVHGVGFVPRTAVWRVLFSPFIGWPLMALGIVLTLTQTGP